MSPAARTPYTSYAARPAAWLRVLVLLLALLVPGTAHCGAAESVVPGGTAAEYDVHDTALRPPARHGHRPVVPLRPVPRPPSVRHPVAKATHPLPVPPRPTLALRSVVLRC
ncbi:hypothetical protein GCM10023084_73490 [Streptomyces lacrimifluminis]|uniref:Uncharacterized protein n=1 Tax=Streptomyces lacrimifluminis TaxID=1500077 RepID=A0A917UKK2_9ACTN|nr:hypothetical protein [Streptomyces lacrimifluminis]GGJ64016.1 hypothetical protein GCM10012282_71570 [Streptomyces lacrimifluminis]